MISDLYTVISKVTLSRTAFKVTVNFHVLMAITIGGNYECYEVIWASFFFHVLPNYRKMCHGHGYCEQDSIGNCKKYLLALLWLWHFSILWIKCENLSFSLSFLVAQSTATVTLIDVRPHRVPLHHIVYSAALALCLQLLSIRVFLTWQYWHVKGVIARVTRSIHDFAALL